MDYRSVVREMRRQNKRMYQLTGEAGVAQNDLYEKCMADGALDRKTKELIGVAIGVYNRCQYCICVHTHGAYQAGATREEILAAAEVAIAFGGGPSVAYSASVLNAALDEFEHDFD